MNIILAFLAFDFIILAHEFGHFIAARASGIKVLEFSLFVGPKLFSIKKGDTEYSLRSIPVLAYVKMEGEEESSDSEASYNKKPPGIRAIVAAAGPLMNLFIAVLLLSVVFSVTGFSTTEVNKVYENTPAYLSGIKAGDIIKKYDRQKVFQPFDIDQFMYVSKGKPVEIEIERDGKRLVKNVAPQIIPKQEKYMFGFSVIEESGADSNLILGVVPGSPAELEGLKGYDRIIMLDNTPVASKQEIDGYMKEHKGGAVKVTVMRDEQEVALDITPVLNKIEEQYYTGIDYKRQTSGIFGVIRQSVVFSWSIIRSVGYSIVWLIMGQVNLSQMMGPVGIVSTIGTVVRQSPSLSLLIINLLNITALFSVALGATNLIPFPALDGSKLLLLAVEGVRKKQLSPEKEAFISMVGFVIIIALAIFTFYNDIKRLAGG